MLPKHLRERKRHILCKLINLNRKQINENSINTELRKQLRKHIFILYGDVGAANIDAKIIKISAAKNEEIYFIVMCNYKYVANVQFALANICQIEEDAKIIVNILKVSGTQKGLLPVSQ